MRIRLEPGLLKCLRSQQAPVPANLAGVLLQQIIVRTKFPGLRSEKATFDALEIVAAIDEILLVELVKE
jgi:hypothetical protein